MTFEFYGWIIEYYVFSISPGHGNSGRGRPESRGNAFEKVSNRVSPKRATSRRAAQLAAARLQVQHRVPWRLLADGDFEAVGRGLSSSARFDEGRARRGSAARNGLATSKMALVSAPAFACNARCEPACVTHAF